MSTPFPARLDRVRARLAEVGADALCVSVGPDLPWLVGYEAMPLERLTMLVVPREGEPVLVVPALEAPRVRERPGVFRVDPWGEAEDPVARVLHHLGAARRVAIGDRTWARFLVELQVAAPHVTWLRGSTVTGPLRAVKDPHELAMLERAAAAADTVSAAFHSGEVPLVGRSESEVAAELGIRLIEAGHDRVNFTIVAAGENSASPHHEPGPRIIGEGEAVLADIGGTMLDGFGVGYCSDITRCVWTGEPPARAAEAYAALLEAQQLAVAAAVPGITGAGLDAVARNHLTDSGWGHYFTHRTGHGIGVEEHEDPYIVEVNDAVVVVGNVFSIEPGVYVPGEFGFRLEDIVVAEPRGGRALNVVDHRLGRVC